MATINDFMTNQTILENLGVCFKNMRLNSHYSQRELAEKTGLSRSTISAIENGKTVTTDALVSILRHTGHLDLLKPFEELSRSIQSSPVMMYKNLGKYSLPQRIRNVNKLKE